MREIIITRKQYERIKQIFEMYDTLDQIKLLASNDNGIGQTTKLEFFPKAISIDITDVESW
jgi:hypothetical protein